MESDHPFILSLTLSIFKKINLLIYTYSIRQLRDLPHKTITSILRPLTVLARDLNKILGR